MFSCSQAAKAAAEDAAKTVDEAHAATHEVKKEKVEVADSEVAAVAANDPQVKKVHILSWPAFRKARLHTSAQRGRLLLPTAAGLSLAKSRDLVVDRDKLGTFRQIAARTAAWSGPMGAGQRASEASAELQE